MRRCVLILLLSLCAAALCAKEADFYLCRKISSVIGMALVRENDMVHQCDSYCAAWCKMVKYVLSTMFKKEFSPENYKELIVGVNFFNADFFKFMIVLTGYFSNCVFSNFFHNNFLNN